MRTRSRVAPPPRGRDRHRVLFLADHLGTADGGVHGVTTYLLDVLPALLSAGMEVGACFLREEHPAAQRLREKGVSVRFLGSRRFDFLVLREVDAIVRREGWNVLHCTQFRASLIGRAVARIRQGTRAILHLHDLTMPPPAIRLMNRIVANREDVGLCVSRAARELAVRGYCIAPERVRVLYTGIDTTRFRPLSPAAKAAIRGELGIPAAAAMLCLVGRFQPVKGQRDMMPILEKIAARRRDCVLLFVGSGPDLPVCEALAEKLGVTGNVRFVGHRDDAPRLLAAADVAVVPSRSEGLSRFAIEANLCGLPVVAFASGGLTEALADDRCGELVCPGDFEAFAAAVMRALQAAGSASSADARVRSASARFGLAAHLQSLRACYDALEIA
ncbi:MAG: glycosyltransferase [Woeseia sp.]